MRLTQEERQLLQRLSKDQLIFLSGLTENYDTLRDIVNYFINIEKEVFFGSKEYDKEKLSADLAFSRGIVAGVTKFAHIIAASKEELGRRNTRKDK